MSPAYISCLLCLPFAIGCSGFDVVNAMSPSSGYLRTANVAYGNLARQKLDVYRPVSSKPPAGIVVFFYGGSWKSGSKNDYRFVAEALTSKGYVAVLPDYRLYPSVVFPAFVEDGALAFRWVHDNAKKIGCDPQHIYLMGHSAGGHIVALLTLDGHYLKAVGLDRSDIRGTVGLAGPYDFKIRPDIARQFGMVSTTQPTNPSIQPINFVDGHAPPMLLLNGGSDFTVEPGNTTRLAAKITQKGGLVKTKIYPWSGHTGVVSGFALAFRWFTPSVLKDSVAFFRQH